MNGKRRGMTGDQSVWDGGLDARLPCTDRRDDEVECEDDGGDAECRQCHTKGMPSKIANDQGPQGHGLVHLPFVEMEDLLRVARGLRIVGHHENGLVEFPMKPREEGHDGLGCASVKIAGGLIRQ